MKEKRENTIKEYDEESEATSNECAKDQLNNVMTEFANNQQSRSLPFSTDIENMTDYKNIRNNHPTCDLNTQQSENPKTKDLEDFPTVKSRLLRYLQSPPIFGTSNNPISANDSTEPVEVSLKADEKLKFGALDDLNIISPCSDTEPKNKKQNTENEIITNKRTLPDILLEDFSGCNIPDRTFEANSTPNITVSTPGYIPILPAISPFYSDSCYPVNGVLWRPLSVLPNVSSNGTVSVHIPNNGSNVPIVQQNVLKKCCKCECHDPLLSYNTQQSSQTPQYVITAVPLATSSVH